MRDDTSVRFTEEMKGHVSFGEEDYERGAREGREDDTGLKVHLTIEVDDLDRLTVDAGRAAEARGWVECHSLGGRLPVERGVFNLLVDDGAPEIKHMLYRLYFRDAVGHPVTLAGFKTLTNRRGLHVWGDTTTLYTRLLRGHVRAGEDPAAEIVASGILRIRPLGFLRQLATFRAGGRRSPVARAAAIVRFDALFLGRLREVYGLHRVRGRLAARKRAGRSVSPEEDSGGGGRGAR
jgi:cholesterol oxidase